MATLMTTGPGQSPLTRMPSVRGSRPIRRFPLRTSAGSEITPGEDNKDVNTQLIRELREQVERAEQASEQYRQQLAYLQQRLDEATDQITAAEEKDFASRTNIDKLVAEVKDHARKTKELESAFESDRNILMQERDRSVARETELLSTVSRLSGSLSMKTREHATVARTNQEDLPTPAQTPDQSTERYLHVLQEKDTMIQALRLEVADVSLRIAEQEHAGDGRLQTLESQLRDLELRNARLAEENDSFQILLGERTIKGDLHLDRSDQASSRISTLAEELETVDENEEVTAESYRRLEAELKNVREEKKALTLYIDKIIGKVLQHEGFEHIITGKDESEETVSTKKAVERKNKPLPLAPSAIESPAATSQRHTPEPPTNPTTFLQRARSVVSRVGPPKRPMSYIAAPPSANENPITAPSIPINRGHRRVRSDQSQLAEIVPGALGQQLQTSPPRATPSSNLNPAAQPRSQASSYTRRLSSHTEPPDTTSSRNSIISSESISHQSTDATSYQASMTTKDNAAPAPPPTSTSASTSTIPSTPASTAITAGVMKQNQLRPLRLVQEKKQEDEDMRRANRGSWIGGWFNNTNTNTNTSNSNSNRSVDATQ